MKSRKQANSIRIDDLLTKVDIKGGSKSKSDKIIFGAIKKPVTELRKLRFNMIEIVVSLLITLVVLLAVISLFDSGLTMNEDAHNRINAGDSMDQFLHQMTSRLEQDWNQAEAFPLEKPESNADP
ncbi:MAG: hypothetical protein HRT89_01410 [Lentisphaeria bacterium]|nr:hypothetical protein [Lentisphaeria bacterium]NQZ66703.1 hypothetical protein [Lentisphaeria bacterium]